jgi:uncharacterized membrane protein YgcG
MDTMAPLGREKIKRSSLLLFVAISVLLICLIWIEGLRVDVPATPSYYRDTFQMNPDIYLTITAEAIERRNELAGTPAPDGGAGASHGGGQGRGQGGDSGGNSGSGSGQGSP